jgi:hypothetical protein
MKHDETVEFCSGSFDQLVKPCSGTLHACPTENRTPVF